ncbi:SDR family NAD(P)-dependent oxidoreductase [Flavisphingomonas formosensis]|uniref:SDR family NAD(P)-dependent oxidoreductase n=1 Tax=Flavisphingomonas formosensis TaxID=861534 RepID=UPI0012FC1276|nr:SDR family NAD(P)-dependent oxidoreductase [Sphingomonas formosensis]
MAELAGRAAFVTGAGSGIGRGIALVLASRGAFIWATDFNKDSAEETVALIQQSGGRGQATKLDVRDEAEWQQALAPAISHDEKLTILVNCAGTSMVTDTFSMSLEDFRRIMAVNVEGTFLGMKHGVPIIAKSGGGSVVNISSMAGLKGMAGMTAYCASKGAIRMMSKAVALECAGLRNGVRVNSVHPGFVDTPALRKHIDDATKAGHGRGLDTIEPDEVAKTAVPIGVACTSEEVGEMVAYLVSHGARHVTGAEIPIDGGMTSG